MSKLEDLKGVFGFLKGKKRWWLAPFIVALLLLGVVILFTESSVLAPLIYTIF